MRESRVLRKLRAGQVASCVKMNLGDARVAEIAGLAGLDCIWPDLEHVPNNIRDLEQMVWAAKAQDMDVMARVPRGSYSDYVRPLEMDAAGIMVPHCMGLKDAQSVIRMTRFQPIGMRAADGGNADGAYCGISFTDYIKAANANRFVALQIEDPEPLEELDAIAALPGVDMLFFGPGDFSHAIEAPGDMTQPRLLKARELVAATARKHGKFAGTVGSAANLQELIGLGYQFISLGADVVALMKYFEEIVAAFGGIREQPAKAAEGIYAK